MKKIAALLPALCLVLAGCSASGADSPTPAHGQIEQSNEASCRAFEDAANTMFDGLETSDPFGEWELARERFAHAASGASGQPQELMQEIVDEWPELRAMADVEQDRQALSTRLARTALACASDGVSMEYEAEAGIG